MVGEGKEDVTTLAWESPPYVDSISDREQPVSLLAVQKYSALSSTPPRTTATTQ